MPTPIFLGSRWFLPSPWAGQWEVTADHGDGSVTMVHVTDPRRSTRQFTKHTIAKVGQRVGDAGEPKGAA